MKHSMPVFLALLLIAVTAVPADKPWYEAYDSALKAIQAKNWPLAEEELKYAMSKGPAQGMRRTYGVGLPIQFVPNYYLGVVYFNTNRFPDALQEFGAVDTKILQPNQRSELNRYVQQAANEVQKTAALRDIQTLESQMEQQLKGKNLEDARKTLAQIQEKQPGNPSLPDYQRRIAKLEDETHNEQAQANKRAQFNELVRNSEQALQTKDYASARTFAQQSLDLGIDPEKSKVLLNSINATQNADQVEAAIGRKDWPEASRLVQLLSRADPENPQLKRWKDQVEKGIMKLESDYVSALRAFYKGDYATSSSLLEGLLTQRRDDPALYFYLGCASAAISYTKKDKDAGVYLEKARKQFLLARRLQADLKVDEKFISPKILQIYRETH